MKSIKCPKCNSTTFQTLDMRDGKYTLVCVCGHVTKGSGGVQVDRVISANLNL